MTPFGVAPRMAGSRFFAAGVAVVPRERLEPPPRPVLPLPPEPAPPVLAPIPSRIRPRQWEAAIIRAVCDEHGLDPAVVVSASRTADCHAARAEIVRRLFAAPGHAMANHRAGLLLGRDPSTISAMRNGGKGRARR